VEGERTAPFVVAVPYAKRAFKCVRVALTASESSPPHAEQWVVTEAGRTVWSFPARADDSHASVQAEVERWWDSRDEAPWPGAQSAG
jgi:hypothetical protein